MTPPKQKVDGSRHSQDSRTLCSTCPLHGTQDYRLEELEKENDDLKECVASIKKDVSTLVTGQAVMQQKFDNLRIPIWIIFGALLLQVAKWVGTFSPVVNSVAENVM